MRKHPVKIKVAKLQIIKLLTQGRLYLHVSFTFNFFLEEHFNVVIFRS